MSHRVAAPSTLGVSASVYLRASASSIVLDETLRRAWAAGAGPEQGRLVIDLDSFVGEVHGYRKQGAAFGYTRQRGYHPLLATRADTGEVLLHIRLRKGQPATPRGWPVLSMS
ncbi:MAG: hypothetical protein R2736_09550 [Solirubrobacterales bacterium]